jgi:hypothetical protein
MGFNSGFKGLSHCDGNYCTAWLFQGLFSLDAMDTDNCIQRETDLLHKYDSGDESFMLHICMGDETWVDNSEPKPKWCLMEW